MSYLDKRLGFLAKTIPGATGVFHKYQLDFCCGGNKTLGEAAANSGIDPQTISDELNALLTFDSGQKCWNDVPNLELIEHILTRYHDVHRQQLPELIRLANRVETVHSDHPECPLGLANYLEKMQSELEHHMCKEENILFPMLSQGAEHMATGPVSVMRREHDDHGEHLAMLERLTYGIQPPKGACNTWRALYLGLRTFKEDLMDHIHLENNILFDRVDGHVARRQGMGIVDSLSEAAVTREDCCGHCS
ncbi:iron-sulfur cluster repair protein YtfE [Cellvibrio sp.]|uniref:iron-sulfur cluster repair protein YtfE n=1 Tax=Cellvibrio sp. TaxID=1965322 RepID=UPI0039647AFD